MSTHGSKRRKIVRCNLCQHLHQFRQVNASVGRNNAQQKFCTKFARIIPQSKDVTSLEAIQDKNILHDTSHLHCPLFTKLSAQLSAYNFGLFRPWQCSTFFTQPMKKLKNHIWNCCDWFHSVVTKPRPQCNNMSANVRLTVHIFLLV